MVRRFNRLYKGIFVGIYSANNVNYKAKEHMLKNALQTCFKREKTVWDFFQQKSWTNMLLIFYLLLLFLCTCKFCRFAGFKFHITCGFVASWLPNYRCHKIRLYMHNSNSNLRFNAKRLLPLVLIWTHTVFLYLTLYNILHSEAQRSNQINNKQNEFLSAG